MRRTLALSEHCSQISSFVGRKHSYRHGNLHYQLLENARDRHYSASPKHVPVDRMKDFAHHKAGVARLNHGSFGACPEPVLRAQEDIRKLYMAQPDEWYYGGNLREGLLAAGKAASAAVRASEDDVCLVENLSVATAIVAKHWGYLLANHPTTRPSSGVNRNGILMLSSSYKACNFCIKEYCERAGGEVIIADVPFPLRSSEEIIDGVKTTIRQNPEKLRFAYIDHITSQPSILVPVKEIVQMCREEAGIEEIAVDGAHALGVIPELDVPSIGAEYYMTNLHKWAFTPPAATLFYAKNPRMSTAKIEGEIHHPIVSWGWGQGMKEEALWAGTRDYTPMLCAPIALEYLRDWRSPDGKGKTVQEHNREGVVAAAQMLSEAWGTEIAQPVETMTSMAMVQLPHKLEVNDKPGEPGGGIRDILREKYGVEAAIGNFGKETGNFVRLSHAVYNAPSDFDRLRDAVLEITATANAV